MAGKEITVTDHLLGDFEKLRGRESYFVDDPGLRHPSALRGAGESMKEAEHGDEMCRPAVAFLTTTSMR